MRSFLIFFAVIFFTIATCSAADDDEFPDEKPTCAVRCQNIDDYVCAGPVLGAQWCGKLKTFRNPCMLSGWNCNHPSYKYEKKYKGLCYPDDPVIGA